MAPYIWAPRGGNAGLHRRCRDYWLWGDSQVVCKASTMGCMPTDPSGGYSGGVGTLGIHRNSILGTIWHRTYGPPGRGAGWVFGRLGPLAPRVLTATPGSFTCRDDHRIPTEASESAYPHAHGRGDVFATRWQPLANSRNASPGRPFGAVAHCSSHPETGRHCRNRLR